MQLDLKLILALASVYVIWGSTYYAMRVAVAGLPPLLMGAARFTLAGAIMLAVDRARGGAWPSARHWLLTLPVGVLFFVGGNGLVAIALESLDSGVAAVVCATMPLWTAVIASATGERSSGREWLGLVIGFAGVAVLLGGASLDGDPLHVVLLILSPLSWACGSILSRRLAVAEQSSATNGTERPAPGGLSVSGMQMATGGVALAAVALLHGERPVIDAPAEAWLALLYLTVFGSLIAFTAFSWLLRNTRPALATSYAYVNPAIAVLLGAVLGGEAFGPTTIIATGLIVGAVALVVRASRR
jgi:drug/metabolite transporter (DMT)-like permease